MAASRFKLIDGGATQGPKKEALQDHRCVPCSDDIGADFTPLVQMLVAPVVRNGEVVGGTLMWCCPRCRRAYYHAKKRKPI